MNDQEIICPACLARYSKLDSPHEYARVMHVLHPRNEAHHPTETDLARLAGIEALQRISAAVLANPGKLPSMTPEEEGELKANLEPCIEFKDLSHAEQAMVRQYLPTRTPILEQVCLVLREFGVDCSFTALTIKVELVEKDCSLLFSHGAVTWEGFGYFAPLAHWVSDVPNSCTDVVRISKAIFGWIKRFDYREYRGNK